MIGIFISIINHHCSYLRTSTIMIKALKFKTWLGIAAADFTIGFYACSLIIYTIEYRLTKVYFASFNFRPRSTAPERCDVKVCRITRYSGEQKAVI